MLKTNTRALGATSDYKRALIINLGQNSIEK